MHTPLVFPIPFVGFRTNPVKTLIAHQVIPAAHASAAVKGMNRLAVGVGMMPRGEVVCFAKLYAH
jgi:hypothetical protein